MFKIAQAARRFAGLVIVAGLAAACVGEAAPKNQAECEASQKCRTNGKCTWDFTVNGCVVGSSSDCARSDVCKKDLRCSKRGDTCEKE